jgi:hypothetical protein
MRVPITSWLPSVAYTSIPFSRQLPRHLLISRQARVLVPNDTTSPNKKSESGWRLTISANISLVAVRLLCVFKNSCSSHRGDCVSLANAISLVLSIARCSNVDWLFNDTAQRQKKQPMSDLGNIKNIPCHYHFKNFHTNCNCATTDASAVSAASIHFNSVPRPRFFERGWI